MSADNDLIRRDAAISIVMRDRIKMNTSGTEFRIVSTQDHIEALRAIDVQPDPRPLSEAEAFALSAPTNAPHASNMDMLEWVESIQQPDPRDDVIATLVDALEDVVKNENWLVNQKFDGNSGWFDLSLQRAALAAAKTLTKENQND